MKYDQSYCLGKGVEVLHGFRFMLDTLDRQNLTPEEMKEVLQSEISMALWDMTKVLSCISETEWNVEDRELVLKDRAYGVEDLLIRYGWLKKEQTVRYRIDVSRKHIYQLSKGTKAASRTVMHEVLRAIPEGTPPYDELRDILEDVTQGVGKWEDIQVWCEKNLGESDAK